MKELNIVLLVIIIVVLAVDLLREKYINKSDKAFALYNWFAANDAPTYTEYKKDFKDANIVEYEDILQMKQRGELTQGNIAKNI
jgi:hypothetical protein